MNGNLTQQRKEELLVRWMDGEVTEEQEPGLEALLADDPALRGMQETHIRIREELCQVYEETCEPPSPDFFNTHLERMIEREEQSVRRGMPAKTGGFSIADFFWRSWFGPASVFGVALAFLAGMQFDMKKIEHSAQAEGASRVYIPGQGVSAEVWEREDDMVVVLTGLPPLPDTLEAGDEAGETTALLDSFPLVFKEIETYY